MDKDIVEKAKKFKILNEIAVKNETVVFGSDFLYNFPFYDLMQGRISDYVVYNRSIEGLKVADAVNVVEDCIKHLQPKNVLISFGENEVTDEAFFKNLNELVIKIKSLYRSARLCILETPDKDDEYNKKVEEIAAQNNVIFLKFDRSDNTAKKEFLRLSSFFRNGNISLCDIFAV